MAAVPPGTIKVLGLAKKTVHWVLYRKVKRKLLRSALREAIAESLIQVDTGDERDRVPRARLAAENLVDELAVTEPLGEHPPKTWWRRLKRKGTELLSIRIPSMSIKSSDFDARLTDWVVSIVFSKNGQAALRSSRITLAPDTSQAKTFSKNIPKLFRYNLQKFSYRDADQFEDSVREELFQQLQAVDARAYVVLDQPAAPSKAIAPVGAGTVGVVSGVVTDLAGAPPTTSVGVGVGLAIVALLGVGVFTRRTPLTRPQVEMRRAVLVWLCALLGDIYKHRPEMVTVHGVRAALERVMGRFEGRLEVSVRVIDAMNSPRGPENNNALPPRFVSRLRELITLAGDVDDDEVQAELIGLEVRVWEETSDYDLLQALQRIVQSLSS